MATSKRTKRQSPSQRSFVQTPQLKTESLDRKDTQVPFSAPQDKRYVRVSEDISESRSEEFLLKEYERLYLLRMDEVKQAEQRVTFFLTIASAAIGLIVVLAQTASLSPDKILAITRVTLIVLLLFGLTILNRMNARIVQLRTFDKLMSEIRGYFRKLNPEIAIYTEKYDKVFQPPSYRFGITKHVLRRLRGTLNDLVILSNALICGGLAFIELYIQGYQSQSLVGLTIAVVIGALVLLYIYFYFFIKRLPPFG